MSGRPTKSSTTLGSAQSNQTKRATNCNMVDLLVIKKVVRLLLMLQIMKTKLNFRTGTLFFVLAISQNLAQGQEAAVTLVGAVAERA
jgi:hypothetical protein